MTGIHLGKSKRRVVSWSEEKKIEQGRVIAAGCVYGVRLGLPLPHLFSFHGGCEEVGGMSVP